MSPFPLCSHSQLVCAGCNVSVRKADQWSMEYRLRIYGAIPHVLHTSYSVSFTEYFVPKRILEWKPIGRIIRGRPRKRWIEDIEHDIQIMGIRGWRKLWKERVEWKRITEKAKTHSGL